MGYSASIFYIHKYLISLICHIDILDPVIVIDLISELIL